MHVQLLELGVSSSGIGRQVQRGRLIRVHRGVYAVGHVPQDPVARCKGALLACGPGSAVAVQSAAAYWQLEDTWPHKPVVAVARDSRRDTVDVRRLSTLDRADIWTQERNLKVTSPARTLLDIAPHTEDKRLAWLLGNLAARGLADERRIAKLLDRQQLHPGTKRLAELIGAKHQARSPWEAEWPAFAKKHSLQGYHMNVKLHGITVDILYPEKLVVWLDGWGTHSLKPQFERDRAEANELLAEHDIPAVRITYTQFHETPARAAGWVAKALRRRQSPAPRPGGTPG